MKGTGIGLGTVLVIVFMVLKLCGVISWSWWWVFAPVWGPLLLVAVICAVVGGAAMLLSRK